jgi:plastocyanin
VALSLVAVASCSRARRPLPVAHTIVMEAVAFRPQALKARAGDTIVWINRDPFPHTATAADGAFDSGPIAPDASWAWTVSGHGTIEYLCRLHPTMKGRVTLAE